MRIAKSRIETTDAGLAIDTTGPAVSPDLESTDFARWVRAWKESLVNLIAGEVGARINLAWSDDAVGLVELAEKNGFRSRNFISMIVDRLQSKAIPIERTRQTPADAGRTLTRWKSRIPQVWVFVDDIDRNFDGSRHDEIRAASFFDACRSLSQQIDILRFRVAVRPNTWATLKRAFESMSHVEQYAFDLKWKEDDMLALLGHRIDGYLRRRQLIEQVSRQLPAETHARHRYYLTLVFETPVQWGSHERPIHVPLDSLSLHRPRWIVELCRTSAAHAAAREADRISLKDDVFSQLATFGHRRLDDAIAEFKVQCLEISEVLDGFRSQVEQYTTAELLTLIDNRILNHVNVRLPGGSKKPGHREVASFLFQIGFIYARRDFDDGSYEHLGYADQPSLLLSRTDLDSGCSWEIPSTYRQALDLRTPEGFVRPIVSRAKKPVRHVVT
jgi:hypothetical protein